jgi:microcystin-dependent protein
MDEFIGIVKLFGGNFAPQGWLLCQGQLLQVRQYTALFSILGTTYGGDGITTFGLPNLNGVTVLGAGTNPKTGTSYQLGQTGGSENVTMTVANMAPHQHPIVVHANTGNGQYSAPKPTSVLAATGKPDGRDFEAFYGYTDATPNVQMSGAMVTEGVVGGGQPMQNMQPYLVMNYIICVEGLYPPRP